MNEDNNCVIIITFKEFMKRADALPQRYILPYNFETLDNDLLGITDWNHCFRPMKLSEEASKVFYKEEQNLKEMYKTKKNNALDKLEKLRTEIEMVLDNNKL